MRYVLYLFLLVSLVGCGVDTDSSLRDTGQDTNISDGDDQTDPTDDNTTDDDDSSTDDLGDPNEDQSRSDFDTRSAEKDQNACIINGTYKNAKEDSSFDPTGTVDEANGIVISSLLSYNADVDKTKVTVYYPDLIATPMNTQTTLYEDYYRLSFDQSWPANSEKTIYVRIPRGIESNYYGCMRYTLSVNTSSIVGQRVYRVNE